MVVLGPIPEVVIFGRRVNVHESGVGRPLSTTLPVGILHVGTVILLTTGAVGVAG
jgi:hypothetical protein